MPAIGEKVGTVAGFLLKRAIIFAERHPTLALLVGVDSYTGGFLHRELKPILERAGGTVEDALAVFQLGPRAVGAETQANLEQAATAAEQGLTGRAIRLASTPGRPGAILGIEPVSAEVQRSTAEAILLAVRVGLVRSADLPVATQNAVQVLTGQRFSDRPPPPPRRIGGVEAFIAGQVVGLPAEVPAPAGEGKGPGQLADSVPAGAEKAGLARGPLGRFTSAEVPGTVSSAKQIAGPGYPGMSPPGVLKQDQGSLLSGYGVGSVKVGNAPPGLKPLLPAEGESPGHPGTDAHDDVLS